MKNAKKETDFEKELFETFCNECEERIESITTALLALEKANTSWDQSPDLSSQFFRDLHSLKGGARAVNLEDLEKLTQQVESVLAPLKEKSGYGLSEEQYQSLFEIIDLINELVLVPPNDSKRKELSEMLSEKIGVISPLSVA